MAENTFPVYKLDDIVQFFRTEVLTGQEAKEFTRNDITPNPKVEQVQRLYMRVLQMLFPFQPESSQQLISQNPMLYESVTPILSLYMRMCKFMPICHVYDFLMSDLLNPKLKRTITILSAVQNFLHFRKSRLETIVAHRYRFRSDMERLQTCNREIKEAEKKIEKLTTVPPEQQAEERELSNARNELTISTQNKFQQSSTLKEMITQDKAQYAESSQKLGQRKLDVATLKDEINMLKSQIVESPEELKTQMERMKENVRSIKNSKVLSEERLMELQTYVQCATQLETEIVLFLKQLHELQDSMCKGAQQKEEMQKTGVLIEMLQKELKALISEEEQIKRTMNMRVHKQSKQQIRHQQKKDLQDQQIKHIYRDYDGIHLKRDDVVKLIEDTSRESKQLKEKMQKLRETCSQRSQKAQEIYDCIIDSLEQYHRRIESVVMETNNDILKIKPHF